MVTKKWPTKNLGPIGSAVLTFIGYKQTDKQTDRQAKFIYSVVLRIVLDKSEQSLEYNWIPGISTTRALAVDTSLLHTTAPGPVLHTMHR